MARLKRCFTHSIFARPAPRCRRDEIMKIFIDSADVNEIREAVSLGLADGVTTNPTLIARSGRNFKEVIAEISALVDGPVSAEVTGLTADEMVEEGLVYAKWRSEERRGGKEGGCGAAGRWERPG